MLYKVNNLCFLWLIIKKGSVSELNPFIAPEEGLEPPTWWLTATRSTN